MYLRGLFQMKTCRRLQGMNLDSGMVFAANDQIHKVAIELWLRKMKYAKRNSTFADDVMLSYPLSTSSKSAADEEWGGFDFYCQNLEDKSYFWESLTVLKILGPIQSQIWGEENYTRLIHQISRAVPAIYSLLCLTASELAYRRFLIPQGSVEDGIQHLGPSSVSSVV